MSTAKARVSVSIYRHTRGYYRVRINGTSIGNRATSFLEARRIAHNITGVSPSQPENDFLDLRRSRPRTQPYLQTKELP